MHKPGHPFFGLAQCSTAALNVVLFLGIRDWKTFMIKRVIIQNFKGLRNTDIQFSGGLNVLVGDNETGKSTVLEAVNLALTGQLNRRSAAYELHPFLFNIETTRDFIDGLKVGAKPPPPEILIEAYLDDTAGAELRGTNNTRNEDSCGIYLKIALDDSCADQYATFLAEPELVAMIPTDYYSVIWESFAQEPMHLRKTPVRPVLIDPGAINNAYAANRYVVEIARDYLSPEQQASIAISYRHIRQLFHSDPNVEAINARLREEVGEISDRTLSIGLDMTAKGNWDTGVQPHLDDLPLSQVGKGEQNSIKIKLALKAGAKNPVLLVEEPENHLSHSNLNKLIGHIADRIGDRQVIATTHSSFVLNKLGIENTLLFNGKIATRIGNLSPGTRDYFLKLPGHDTLRMVLARRSILVEGPSDELIVQRAYKQVHGKMPLEDGVEVISVYALAFKRFLEIAKELDLDVAVVTDNDGEPERVAERYAEFMDLPTVRILFSEDAKKATLEPQLLGANGFKAMCDLLEHHFVDEDALLRHMAANKTDVALRLFEADADFVIPDYITHAIA